MKVSRKRNQHDAKRTLSAVGHSGLRVISGPG